MNRKYPFKITITRELFVLAKDRGAAKHQARLQAERLDGVSCNAMSGWEDTYKIDDCSTYTMLSARYNALQEYGEDNQAKDVGNIGSDFFLETTGLPCPGLKVAFGAQIDTRGQSREENDVYKAACDILSASLMRRYPEDTTKWDINPYRPLLMDISEWARYYNDNEQ